MWVGVYVCDHRCVCQLFVFMRHNFTNVYNHYSQFGEMYFDFDNTLIIHRKVTVSNEYNGNSPTEKCFECVYNV